MIGPAQRYWPPAGVTMTIHGLVMNIKILFSWLRKNRHILHKFFFAKMSSNNFLPPPQEWRTLSTGSPPNACWSPPPSVTTSVPRCLWMCQARMSSLRWTLRRSRRLSAFFMWKNQMKLEIWFFIWIYFLYEICVFSI